MKRAFCKYFVIKHRDLTTVELEIRLNTAAREDWQIDRIEDGLIVMTKIYYEEVN